MSRSVLTMSTLSMMPVMGMIDAPMVTGTAMANSERMTPSSCAAARAAAISGSMRRRRT